MLILVTEHGGLKDSVAGYGAGSRVVCLSAMRNGIGRLFANLNKRAEIAIVIHDARSMSPVPSKAATSFEADAGLIKSNDRRCMASKFAAL